MPVASFPSAKAAPLKVEQGAVLVLSVSEHCHPKVQVVPKNHQLPLVEFVELQSFEVCVDPSQQEYGEIELR